MRIIKQFKESLTPTDILKRMKAGDIININAVLYLKSAVGLVISEYGTTWNTSVLADTCKRSEIRCLVRRMIGDTLIDAITEAERGYI